MRLSNDGVIDASFQPAANYGLQLVQADGRILAGASDFGMLAPVRLNTDGSLDNPFASLSTPSPIFIGDDYAPNYVQQPDGKIITTARSVALPGSSALAWPAFCPTW